MHGIVVLISSLRAGRAGLLIWPLRLFLVYILVRILVRGV